MISAYQTGLAAGSNASYHHPELTLDAQRIAAKDEVAKRIKLGIAHLYPEEEFVKGFLEGYRTPYPFPDGLTLYASKQ
jgi:hypothetical protein